MLTVGFKGPLFNVIPDFLHHIIVEKQIMGNRKPHSEHFLGFEKMTQISFGIAPTDRAGTERIYRGIKIPAFVNR